MRHGGKAMNTWRLNVQKTDYHRMIARTEIRYLVAFSLISVFFLFFFENPVRAADRCNNISQNSTLEDFITVVKCLNMKISDLEAAVAKLEQVGGSSRTISVRQIPSVGKPSVSASFTAQNVRFDLIECLNSNGTVRCKFVVTAEKKDASLRIDNDTTAFAESGQESRPNSYLVADRSVSTSTLYKDLIADFPLKIEILFSGFGRDVDRLAQIRFRTLVDGSWSWSKISNIAVSQK
tara:strand:+ start:126 stop:833 length:708 start_codon:yes stop_codon:yes gene_type:complete